MLVTLYISMSSCVFCGAIGIGGSRDYRFFGFFAAARGAIFRVDGDFFVQRFGLWRRALAIALASFAIFGCERR